MRSEKQKALAFILILMLVLLCGCSAKQGAETQTGYNSIEDLAGKRIGVQTGTKSDIIAEEHIRDARIEYFNATADPPLALDMGKIDAYVMDEPLARAFFLEYPDQYSLAVLEEDQYGFVFSKTELGTLLHDQFNEYLAGIMADGTYSEMIDIWFGADESLRIVDTASLTGENGVLRFATESGVPPIVYVRDNEVVGFEIDLAARFCKKYGYGLDISDMNFTGLLASVSSRKSDFAAACISITEERKENMLFSEPDYIGKVVAVVKDNKAAAGKSLPAKEQFSSEEELTGTVFDRIAASFEKTFIRENRWKLFTSGIGITVLITVLSAMFGTGIGFLIYLVYRKKNRIFNGILDVIMDILEKTPVVVTLMILYYVIFGSLDLDGVWVAVVGFTILFACGLVRTVDIGVRAIDNGQSEASLALGFTDTGTFLHVILPQAARHFLPNYRGNIVSLLKDTAIVGYIAVQDLTKVGDIVRSRTYEAFFPLIATAVIYFLLAWLLTLLVSRIEFSFDPRRRGVEKLLKGVKTK